jgi:hypothetical protein
METLCALAAHQGLEARRRQFDTPEWQHRAAALAAREPWHERFARQVRRLKPLASQPRPAWQRPEESR